MLQRRRVVWLFVVGVFVANLWAGAYVQGATAATSAQQAPRPGDTTKGQPRWTSVAPKDGVSAVPAQQPIMLRLPDGVKLPSSAPAATASPAREQAINQLLESLAPRAQAMALKPKEGGESPRTARTSDGWLRSVGAPPGRAFAAAHLGPRDDPGGIATGFMRLHGEAFGVSKEAVSFREERVKRRGGRQFVRLAQEFGGIPVFGAAVVVQLDASGDVEFVLSDVARDDARFHQKDFATRPVVGAGAARSLALTVPELALEVSDLVATEPALMIYEPSVIGNYGTSRLVWHLQVTSESGPVDEVVLVDAHTGEVAFHFSQIMDAKSRAIYDCNNVVGSTGSLARSEGQAATGNTDVDLAYDYFGDTYDFYWSHFGRDGIDGAGMTMIGRVRYCQAGYTCPYPNAFWNGSEMRFGQGYAAADDVVGHELTHGVTQYESRLIYWSESGAINESLSDIFGEFIDLTNGKGTDTPAVRWYIGEDLPTGAGRYMLDPPNPPSPCYPVTSCSAGQNPRQPDRRYSGYWYTGDLDQRGVHINSGVGNKLAYLLTDGATFNGQTVSGMGINAVAALFYEAQTNLLGPASDYFDLDAVLGQAAINLAWTPAQRANLERASRAVEIALPASVVTIFSDGFEGSFPGLWAVYDSSGVGTQWGKSTAWAASGSASAWCAAGGTYPQPSGGPYVNNMDTWMVYGPFSLASVVDAYMGFDMILNVEAGYDYVWWGLSIDGLNFYGFPVSTTTAEFPNPVHEVMNFRDITAISALGQSSVWIAFYFHSDASGSNYAGAYIDNVVINKAVCAAPSSPILTAPALAASGSDYTVSWSATSPLDTYELQEATDPSFGGASTYSGSGTSAVFNHTVSSPTTYYYRVRASDNCGGSTWNSTWSGMKNTTVNPAAQTLTVSKAGTGTGTVSSSPAGINCGSTCSTSFDYNTVVTLSASADAGSTFTGWSGEGCSGTGTCQVTTTQTRSVEARFGLLGPDLAVTLEGTPSPVVQGQELVYTAHAHNVGTAAATGVTLSVWPPIGGASLGTVTPSQGSCSGSLPVTCTLGGIAASAEATVTLHVVPGSSGTLPLRAEVAADSDTDPGNNTATMQTPCLAARPGSIGVNTWTPFGPDGGNVYAITRDPFDAQVLYAATLNGAFKSTDRAAHWTRIFGPTTAVVAPHPTLVGVLFLADRSRQIYKSTDGGQTWLPSGTGITPQLSPSVTGSFLFWPGVANTLFFSRGDSLFKSTDGGATWTALNSGAPLSTTGVGTVVLDPNGGSPVIFVSTGSDGVFKSTDGGTTWNPASTGLPSYVSGGKTYVVVRSLALVPGSPPTLLAVSGRDYRVYASTDGGSTWVAQSDVIHYLSQLVPATAGGTVYAIGNDGGGATPSLKGAVYVSHDVGATWSILTTTYGYNPTFIAVDPSDSSALYAGLAEGVYSTRDGGVSWSPANAGLRAMEFSWGIAYQPSDPATWYAHGGENGIFKTTDGGAIFSNVTGNIVDPANGVIAVDPNDPQIVYSAGQTREGAMHGPDWVFSYFVRSTNGGTSWNPVSNPDTGNRWNLQPWGIVALPTVPSTIYAAASSQGGVFKSVDGGVTFVRVSTGLPSNSWISDLASSDAVGSALYVADRSGVFKSTNGGASWVSASVGLPTSTQIRKFAVHPTDPATLYCATNAGIYKTVNAGDTWVSVNTGWPLAADGVTPATAYAIAIDATDPTVLYAAALVNGVGAVYTSRDAGGSWWPLNSGAGLDAVDGIWRLAVDPADHTHLIASTRGGLYETKLDLRRLTVSKAGTGSGTVTSVPGGIACGMACYGDFADGEIVTLTATTAAGSSFTGWSGEGCTGTGTCQVTMSQARSVTATFTVNTYALGVTKAGTGTGTVTSNPVGISCGATCSTSFDYNTPVTLSATADTGSTFTGWSGEGCSGTGTCQVTMTQARSVTATFTVACTPVTLLNQTITTTQTFTSCSTLTAGPAFRVGSPGNVTFHAATRVILANGFSVGPGATFTAGLDPSLAP
jgi:Zn-dependent metalloprotease